jgi:hypothetical protein
MNGPGAMAPGVECRPLRSGIRAFPAGRHRVIDGKRYGIDAAARRFRLGNELGVDVNSTLRKQIARRMN